LYVVEKSIKRMLKAPFRESTKHQIVRKSKVEVKFISQNALK